MGDCSQEKEICRIVQFVLVSEIPVRYENRSLSYFEAVDLRESSPIPSLVPPRDM